MRADPKASADAKARGGFWGPWLPNGPFVPPHPPPGPSPGPHPVPPEPPSEGFAIIRAGAEACPGYGCEGMDASSANACLTVDGLSRESRAVLGPCDGGSKWEVREGGLANVAAKKPKVSCDPHSTPKHTKAHQSTPTQTNADQSTPKHTKAHQRRPTQTKAHQSSPKHTKAHQSTPKHTKAHQS